MTQLCAQFDPLGPYAKGILGYVDCQTANLAEQGYRAIGAGTQFAQALDGLLIITVALFGYRMLMGHVTALREGFVLVLKIGFVLALAQHWSSFRPAVYNFATGTPQVLVGQLLGDIAASPDAQLVDRVEGVNAAIALILHPERGGGTLARTQPRPPVAGGQDPANQAGPELAPDVRETLTSADTLLLLTMLTSTIALRIAMALLLAIGPLFVATLLFTGTRAIFAGWVRALIGTMMGLALVPVVLAFELALLEPQVAALAREFTGGAALGALPDRIWVTTGVFAGALLLGLFLTARAVAAPRFSVWARAVVERFEQTSRAGSIHGSETIDRHTPIPTRDHAERVADAARSTERRDELAANVASRTKVIERQRASEGWHTMPVVAGSAVPGRASTGRVSAAAQRRDRN